MQIHGAKKVAGDTAKKNVGREYARKQFQMTYNNYTEDGEENLKEFITATCKMGFFGHEICPNTGTPHLQGRQFTSNILDLQKNSHYPSHIFTF